MSTQFDDLAKQAFLDISNLMGEGAVWLSSKNITGRVLFKNPTDPVQIGDAENYEYRPNSITVEYFEGTFTGLRESIDLGHTEYILVRERTFLVASIGTKFDGKTYVAYLEPHEDAQ